MVAASASRIPRRMEVTTDGALVPGRDAAQGSAVSRSFSPEEFAIALEQVVAGTAPEEYRDPEQFFSRTCFTRALNEHAGMVLRRLAGRTETRSWRSCHAATSASRRDIRRTASSNGCGTRSRSAPEVSFDADVYLLTKAKAEAPKACPPDPIPPQPGTSPGTGPAPEPDPKPGPRPQPMPDSSGTVLQLAGSVPPEVWNRIGIKLLPKLRSGKDLSLGIDLSMTVDTPLAPDLEDDLRQILADLGLSDRVRIQTRESDNAM